MACYPASKRIDKGIEFLPVVLIKTTESCGYATRNSVACVPVAEPKAANWLRKSVRISVRYYKFHPGVENTVPHI